MGVSENSVTYVGSEVLSQADDDDGRPLTRHVEMLSTYSLRAITQVSIPIVSTSFTNATELFADLSSKLETAVVDGSFSDLLRNVSVEVGATVTVEVQVTDVQSDTPVVSTGHTPVVATALAKEKTTTRQVIVLAVGGFVSLWIVASWLYLKKLQREEEEMLRYRPTLSKTKHIHMAH